MKHIKVQSDYSPDTYMKMVQTDDGDIVFKICGEGEMRIATSGGQFHGEKMVKVVKACVALMDAINMSDEEVEDTSPCDRCVHRNSIEHCLCCPNCDNVDDYDDEEI